MNNHYLIFETGGCAHSCVRLVQAPSRYDALKLYLEEEYSLIGFIINADGTVLYDKGMQAFPHLIALIESESKIWGEWQIRRLRPNAWESRYAEIYCGERAPDVETCFDLCRPAFRKDFPRVHEHAFLWYLTDAYLVTFYRRRRTRPNRPIEILGRYIIPHATYPEVQRWDGDYGEILARMWL